MSPEGTDKNSTATGLEYQGNNPNHPSQEAGVGQNEDQSKPLTTEDVKAIVAANNEKVADLAARKAQSYFDRRSGKFEEKLDGKLAAIDQTVAMMAKKGTPMPQAEVDALKQQAIIDATTEAKQPPSSPGLSTGSLPGGQSQITDEQRNAVTQEMIQFVKNSGVELTAEEKAMLNLTSPNPEDYKASVRKAVAAAQARIQNNNANDSENTETPPAPTGSLPMGNIGRRINDGAVESELNSLLANPSPKNKERIAELQQKLINKLNK